jgi:hypothetical protein
MKSRQYNNFIFFTLDRGIYCYSAQYDAVSVLDIGTKKHTSKPHFFYCLLALKYISVNRIPITYEVYVSNAMQHLTYGFGSHTSI